MRGRLTSLTEPIAPDKQLFEALTDRALAGRFVCDAEGSRWWVVGRCLPLRFGGADAMRALPVGLKRGHEAPHRLSFPQPERRCRPRRFAAVCSGLPAEAALRRYL